jgi:hypothetical protein
MGIEEHLMRFGGEGIKIWFEIRGILQSKVWFFGMWVVKRIYTLFQVCIFVVQYVSAKLKS